MKTLSRWILIMAVAIAASCFSGKSGPRGTNIGTGSDMGGPWTKGESTGGGGGSPAGGAQH